MSHNYKILKKVIRNILLENENIVDDTQLKNINDKFTIPAEYLHNFQSVVIDINKKLSIKNAKFNLKILKTFEKNSKIFHEIQIEGILPIINNFEFVAKIEHLATGNVINCNPSLKDTDQIISKYGHSTQQCDICKTTRDRNNTFILKNIKTNETFTVGSTCLKKFVTIEDATSFLDIANRLSEMLVMFNEIKHTLSMGSGNDSYLSSGWKNKKSGNIPISELLLYGCISVISTGRYKSKSETYSTAYDVTELMYGIQNSEIENRIQKFYMSAGRMRDNIMTFIHDFDFKKASIDNPKMSTYFHNLDVLSHEDSINIKNLGYILSMIPLYQRYEKASKQNKNGYVGVVGSKINVDVKINNIKPISASGTPMNLYSMEDRDGNIIAAFVYRKLTSNEIENNRWTNNYNTNYNTINTSQDDLLNDIYKSGKYTHISGLVKKQEENKYEGNEKTTYISNISLDTVPDSEILNKPKISEYIGNVGDKITTDVKVNNVRSFESEYYGVSYFYSMEDRQGNKILWISSVYNEQLDKLMDTLEFVKITGKIKKTEPNKYDNNAKTTYLIRVKILSK